MSSTIRIRVRTPPQLGSHRFWYTYRPSNFESAGDLLDGILRELGLYNLGLNLGLYLTGYEILPATSLDVIRDGDVVFVRLLDGEGRAIIEQESEIEPIESHVEEESENEDEEEEEEEEDHDDHGDPDEEDTEGEEEAIMSVKGQHNTTDPGHNVSIIAPVISSPLASIQNGPESLRKLSVDVFVEIASFGLTSRDILTLAWVNKHFYQLLFPSSSIHIWQMAERNNPENLPARPRDLSPPSFALLIFFNYCSLCARPVGDFHRSDLYHRMRLCNSCRTKNTLPLTDRSIGFDLVDLVPRSKELLVSPFSGIKVLPPYVLRRDVGRLRSKLSSLKASENVAELKAWKAGRFGIVARRLKEAAQRRGNETTCPRMVSRRSRSGV
ncbi:hypothetical protein BDV93DRAFT_252705 [Ceratobasidium sp. AG-I]|nr:hypothetical protein BDV93DRAFT_252705 [Ceratobasidium sp. AG-I]